MSIETVLLPAGQLLWGAAFALALSGLGLWARTLVRACAQPGGSRRSEGQGAAAGLPTLLAGGPVVYLLCQLIAAVPPLAL